MGSNGKWKDYYQLLGIPKCATEDQIKKSYRKLALQIHPDKNKAEDAEERFKEIGEAYETLTDKFKRLHYDLTYESEFVRRQNFQRDFYYETNINNNAKRKKAKTYSNINNNESQASCFYPDFQWQNAVQDPAVVNDVFVNLEEIFRGCTKTVKFTRGYYMNGLIVKTEDKFYDIHVKAGWKAGTKITFAREGNRFANRIPADIIFVIKERNHPLFIRNNCDLKYIGKITQEQAMFNKEIEVPLICGGVTKFPFTEDEIQEVFIKHFKGLGLPKNKNPSERGDLIAEFHFIFTVKERAKKILLNEIREFRQRRS